MPAPTGDATRDQLAADVDAAMHRTLDAENPDELRRALVLAFSRLYSWREYERRQYGERTGTVPRNLSEADPEYGEYIEAIFLWRIVVEHYPEQAVELRDFPLYPNDRLFPSKWLFPGRNLCFVPWDRAPQRIRDDSTARAKLFRERLAGQPLLPWLSFAADRLACLNAGGDGTPATP